MVENPTRKRKQQLEKATDILQKEFERINQFLKTATPRTGQGKKPKEVKSNITDNESAKMTTSKGTIQGYNGVAAVDKKYQIIVDAQAFGEGPATARKAMRCGSRMRSSSKTVGRNYSLKAN